MIVYNISMKIDPSIEKDWLQWQQQEHIPAVMASGQFTAYKFYRLLEQDDRDSITYIIQYFASSLKNYRSYSEQTAPLLRQKAVDKWGNKFIAFRTVMQAVN
jgi:Domain of unknown function (DUF4286)